jgi:hypothetical protein
MLVNNSIKILLIFFGAAILIILSVLGYMVFSSKGNKQVFSPAVPLTSDNHPASQKAANKPVGQKENTLEPASNIQTDQNIPSAAEIENKKEEMIKAMNRGNPPASQPSVTSTTNSLPTAQKTPTVSLPRENILPSKENEEQKRKIIEAMNR